MAEQGSEEKTESPTQKKRDDAREEGQVAFSKELSGTALLGSILLFYYFSGPFILRKGEELMLMTFQNIIKPEFNVSSLGEIGSAYLQISVTLVLPLFGVVFLIGFLASALQVGIKFTVKPLAPKIEKLSPLSGIGKIFSKQAFSELVKSIVKLGVIGYLGYMSFQEELQVLLNFSANSVEDIITQAFQIIGFFTFRLFLALLVLALVDYFFQRWDLEQKLKMSKQDVKEEMKQLEGDPQLKAKIKQIQQKMSQARMVQEVPKADVVVRNPTHFAVALLYDREVNKAPQVIAKGMDHLALRMIDIAEQNSVVVYSNPPIARSIYFQAEVGDEIPEELYKAVAEILAFVYKTKKKRYN